MNIEVDNTPVHYTAHTTIIGRWCEFDTFVHFYYYVSSKDSSIFHSNCESRVCVCVLTNHFDHFLCAQCSSGDSTLHSETCSFVDY